MELHSLTKAKTKAKRRLGQGHGSGRMKTSGRGTKGQKARNSVPIGFEGGALPLIKRLPFRRGKGRNNTFISKPVVINVSALNSFKPNSKVTLEALVKENLVSQKEAKVYGVKLLGDGELTVALSVTLPMTNSAREKILKAGGQVEPEQLPSKTA